MNETTHLLEQDSRCGDALKRDSSVSEGAVKSWLRAKGFFAIGTALIFISVIVVSYVRTATTSTQSVAQASSVETPQLLTSSIAEAAIPGIVVTNEYSNREGFVMFDYPFLRGTHLMEPYRDSTVTTNGLSTNCGVHWQLKPSKNAMTTSPSGVPNTADSSSATTTTMADDNTLQGFSEESSFFQVTASGPGNYVLQLNQKCTSDGPLTFPITVKYVRRELMSLTARDRDEYLDALKTLWDVNTVDGQLRFGAEYKSLHYLGMIHNDAVSGDCDNFHGGLGFINNHVLIGAYLEQSLQLVNRRTCLHYMEYSKYFSSDRFLAGHRENANDGGTWTKVMTAEWFGSNDPRSGRILDGRWANLQVPLMNDAFFEGNKIEKYSTYFVDQDTHIMNPFGLLRAPWNFSPDTFVMRFNNVDLLDSTLDVDDAALTHYAGVNCDDYYDFISSSVVDQPLATCLSNIEDRTHGIAHFTIGGNGGNPVFARDKILRERFGLTSSDLVLLSYAIHVLIKNSVTFMNSQGGRKSLLNCTSIPFDYDTGKLTSPMEDFRCFPLSEYMQSEDMMDEFISGVLNTGSRQAMLKFRMLELDATAKEEFINTLMILQYDGELAGSSASNDPIFWVVHGAVERFYQRIVFEGVLADMDYDTDVGCEGHATNGTKPWLEGFYFQDRTIAVANLTNAELLKILTPTSDEYSSLINFVYESSSWDWCPDFDNQFTLPTKGK